MASFNQEIDIARSLKTIEWLKSDLLGHVSHLFKAFVKGQEEPIIEALAKIILAAYLLGKRIGINFSKIEMKMDALIKENIASEHELEKWYGDLSSLQHYLKK